MGEQTCDLLELDTIVTLTQWGKHFWTLTIDGRSLEVKIEGLQRHHLDALVGLLESVQALT
jgi:hypothetical protein